MSASVSPHPELSIVLQRQFRRAQGYCRAASWEQPRSLLNCAPQKGREAQFLRHGRLGFVERRNRDRAAGASASASRRAQEWRGSQRRIRRDQDNHRIGLREADAAEGASRRDDTVTTRDIFDPCASSELATKSLK